MKPKFRIRDGEATLKGTSIFSGEMDVESFTFAPGGTVRAFVDNETFS